MGLAGTPSTTAIVSSLPASKQGVASAVNDTSREFGSAVGIAILGTILNSRYRSGLGDVLHGFPAVVGDRARASIAFVRIGSRQLAAFGAPGRLLIATAKSSFVSATSAALLIAAGTLLIGAIVVFFLAPHHDSNSPPA
jgi:hypothetical protein